MSSNRSFCDKCHALVPARRVEREGKVYLVKSCPDCGETEALVSSDAQRHMGKRALDPGFPCQGCGPLNCPECQHHRAPTFAFVDVTNRCNQRCPVCVDGVPAYGFVFDPPMEYFERIFDYLAALDPLPVICLFGGEPTVRDDLCDIVELARDRGFYVRVLTNGIRLRDEAFCRKVVKSRAHLLVSYDGDNPETYALLRGSGENPRLQETNRR
ncbi:MAG: radical SAM protein [Planctomycetota bacterium]